MLQKATKGEWDAVVAAEQGRDGIVRLKGLPTKATTGDVMAFLDVRVGVPLSLQLAD